MSKEEQFAWFRPDLQRVIVNPSATLQFAAVPLTLPPHDIVSCPAVMINLLAQHRSFSLRCIAECQKMGIRPILHVWDRSKKTPQLGILFVIRSPSHEFLSAAFPGNEEVIRSQEWKDMRLFFDAEVESKYIEQFCSMYKRMCAAAVIVTESQNSGAGIRMLDSLKPVARFVARDLEFVRPILILNPNER